MTDIENHKHGGDIYRHKNVIDFSANCNPFGTPESVKEAAAEAMERISDYPDTDCEELRNAIADYEKLPSEYIICGNGAADLIFSLVLSRKPEKALLMAPAFAEYEQALSTVGCQIKRHYLMEERGFIPDDGIIDDITEDIDILFLCNPNNPTGVVISQELLVNVLEKCREKNVFFVLDECFTDFLDEPEKHTLKHILKDYDNFFILKAFTKRYAMAGIRLGYGLCSNSTVLDKIKEVTQPWNVSVPAQAAGVAALKEESYVRKTMEYLKKEKIFLKEELAKAGFKIYSSEANYVFFRGPEDLYDYCLDRGVMIRNCDNYEGLTKGYFRVAVKLRKNNLKLINILKNYKGK